MARDIGFESMVGSGTTFWLAHAMALLFDHYNHGQTRSEIDCYQQTCSFS